MIIRCNCKNEYQDKQYGENMRVHNRLQPVNGRPDKYRCTVCLSVRESQTPAKK